MTAKTTTRTSGVKPRANESDANPATPVDVCLFSTHPLFFQRFESLAASHSHLRFVTCLLDAAAVASASLEIPRADIFVIDGCCSRVLVERLASYIADQRDRASILVCSDDLSPEAVFPFLCAGVKGLIRFSEIDDLAKVIERMRLSGYYVPRPLLSQFIERLLPSRPAGLWALSRREQQILKLVLQNLSNKEIASRLNISERTVKFHVGNLLAKHNFRRRTDLILYHFQAAASSRRAPVTEANPISADSPESTNLLPLCPTGEIG